MYLLAHLGSFEVEVGDPTLELSQPVVFWCGLVYSVDHSSGNPCDHSASAWKLDWSEPKNSCAWNGRDIMYAGQNGHADDIAVTIVVR